MAREMAADMALPLTAQALLPGRRVRLIDGSSVSEPGATGSTWRLHYALNLHTLSCDEVHVTEADIGESLTHFDIQAGDVIMADRGFANIAVPFSVPPRPPPSPNRPEIPDPALQASVRPRFGTDEWPAHGECRRT